MREEILFVLWLVAVDTITVLRMRKWQRFSATESSTSASLSKEACCIEYVDLEGHFECLAMNLDPESYCCAFRSVGIHKHGCLFARLAPPAPTLGMGKLVVHLLSVRWRLPTLKYHLMTTNSSVQNRSSPECSALHTTLDNRPSTCD
jgi:hypothetical protein